jgi:hypothetical protein
MRHLLYLLVVCILTVNVNAQVAKDSTATKRFKIAVFAPLYIDSAFVGYTYKLGATSMPRYIMNGLDFYHGVMAAIDTMNKQKLPLEVQIYDTKKAEQSIGQIIGNIGHEKIQLVIAAVTNMQEQQALASYAFNNNIPVVSATYPNDAGLSMNPFYIMLNSSLRTHIDAQFQLLSKQYSKSSIVVFSKQGALEDKIKQQLKLLNANNTLRIKLINLADNFTEDDVLLHLDSTKQNIILCGSINEQFGVQLARHIAAAKVYKTTLLGMPTWATVNAFEGNSFNNIEVVYTTPFNPAKTSIANNVQAAYRNKYGGRPSDMYLRGYESTLYFARLLVKHGSDQLLQQINTGQKVISEFNIQPAFTADDSYAPDFLENKKLYYLKRFEGKVTIW